MTGKRATGLGMLSLLAVTALAGCLGDGDSDGGEDGDRDDDGTLQVVPPERWETVLAGPGGDAETSLTVSADGQTVLVCSHGGFTQASPLWASTDAGATYRRLEPSPNQPFNGDCDVAITDDGAWHIVYDTIASATFASSQDQGASWFVHPFTAEPFGGVDRPWILAVGNDVVLVWADVMSALPFLAFGTRTSDHGRTWTPHVPIGTAQPGAVSCFLAHPVVAPAGALQVPIVCGDDGVISVGPVFLLESENGLVWERVATGARSGGAIAASYAGDGGLWLTVSEPDGDGNRLGLVHSTDNGRSFGEPLWLDGEVTPGFGWFWVDGRPDGSATAAWMDDGPEEGTWQASAARVALSTDGPVIAASGHVGPAGEPVLYEFFMVRHDAQGRAFISIPQLAGPQCAEPGDLPPAGTDRNLQCVYVVREPALGTSAGQA